jgi:hypothetical protein
MARPSEAVDKREFRAEVVRRKLVLEHLRVKAHAVANIDRGNLPKPAAEFFDACLQYFESTGGKHAVSYGAYYTALLADTPGYAVGYAVWDVDPANYKSQDQYYAKLLSFLNIIKAKWSAVTLAYAAARTTLL